MAPTDFYHRIKDYYTRHSEKDMPVISSQTAALLSILYIVLYVAPFYLSPTTRPSPTLSRDAPSVIRARIRAVTLSCVVCSLATLYLIVQKGNASLAEGLRMLGWWPIQPLDIAKTLFLTAILFTGPLFESGIAEGEWRDWFKTRWVVETLNSWIGWRNFVAGPVTEEVIFRSILIPVHLLAKMSPSRVVFVTPLYFGIAHVHHCYEFRLTHPDTSFLPTVLRSLFQFTYTTIFGWFVSFVYLRTGSLYAVILIHSFCNWCGLPRLWGRVTAGYTVSAPIIRSKDDTDAGQQYAADGTLGVQWTVAYYALLVFGAVAFYHALWPLTESTAALVSFSSGK